MLSCLLYTSRARPGLLDADVASIVASANRHNAAAGVTGALLLYAERFMQVVEGPSAEVDACYERICADPRHGDIVLLSRHEIAERRFGRWSMRHVRVTAGADRTVSAFFAELMSAPTAERVDTAINLLRGLSGHD